MAALFWLSPPPPTPTPPLLHHFNILFQILSFVAKFITFGFYLVYFCLIRSGCCVRLTLIRDWHVHWSFAPKHWEDDGREAVNASRCVAQSSQVDHAVPWPFGAARGAKGVDFSSSFLAYTAQSLPPPRSPCSLHARHMHIFTVN